MALISLIAAVDKANGIGKNNQLLCHLPADLQHFKSITLGKPVIMGRNTYESIGKPLPGRLNIVLSKTRLSIEGVQVCQKFEKALELTQAYPEIMIIGGATLYAQTIEMANKLYITHIQHEFGADTFFPHIDELMWNCTDNRFRAKDEKNIFDLSFCTYHKE